MRKKEQVLMTLKDYFLAVAFFSLRVTTLTSVLLPLALAGDFLGADLAFVPLVVGFLTVTGVESVSVFLATFLVEVTLVSKITVMWAVRFL